jgi:predicted anti-sigma-YlaC factor YlaD
MRDVRPTDCERTRQWVSAGLDCELSHFERVLVAAHVARCDECRTFEANVTTFTTALRHASPEQLRGSVTLPTRRSAAWLKPARLARIGSAAAAVATVLLAVVAAPERGSLQDERALVGAPLERSGGGSDLISDLRTPSLAWARQSAIVFRTGGIGAHKPPLSPTL